VLHPRAREQERSAAQGSDRAGRPVVGALPVRLHEGRAEPQGHHLLPRSDVLLPAAVGQDAGCKSMAMRTASPWSSSLIFGLGLRCVLLRERSFGHLSGVLFVLTGLGVLAIVGIAGARAWAMMSSTGARRGVERTLVWCHAGTLLAIVLYVLTTEWGLAR